METDAKQARIQEIKRLQRGLIEELARLEGEAGTDSRDPIRRPRISARPLRDRVLDALDELGVMAYSREMMFFISAMYGENVDATRFGSLRHKERDSALSGKPRSLYIASGLTEKGEAIKRVLARSDWDLKRRIVAPTTGRWQFLAMTRRLCEIALEKRDHIAKPDIFQLLVADHARDLPGANFKRSTWEPGRWRNLADSLLHEIDERDDQQRSAIALRLGNQLSEFELLFGTESAVSPEPRIVTPITEASFG